MKTPFRVVILCIAALFIARCAPAQNATFVDALKQNRFSLNLSGGKLAGPGGDVLRAALADAQFVLVGEDHGIQQIPGLVGAVCNDLGPLGFHTMTLETGPSITPELERFARSADGLKQLTDFEKKFPASIAFYNWQEEFDMLANCEKAGGTQGMTLWGIDQELMGASGFLLDKILATNPGPQAKTAIAALVKENAEDYAAAAKTGNPGEVFMMKAAQDKLDAARDLLKKEGNAEAQQLFGALLVSREIYQKNMTGSYYPSNRQRALLMKKNFVELFGAAMQKGGAPKVLFKFGGWHMYRGLNPIHSSEIGNLANEFAEAHGLKSVSILVLGVKGEQSHFAGIGRPFQAAPLDLANDKDSEFSFMAPFLANSIENQWTIFDLRALRNKFHSYGKLDPEIERLTFGMDFVVLIPDPKASHQVQ
jgi:hypothetical protein